jgi:hypothetical protein
LPTTLILKKLIMGIEKKKDNGEDKKPKLVKYAEPLDDSSHGAGSPFDSPKLIAERRRAFEKALNQELEEKDRAEWAGGAKKVFVSFSNVISQERWGKIFGKKEDPDRE